MVFPLIHFLKSRPSPVLSPSLFSPSLFISVTHVHSPAVIIFRRGQGGVWRVGSFRLCGHFASGGLESLRARGGGDHLRRGLVQSSPRRSRLHHLHLRLLLRRSFNRSLLLLREYLRHRSRNSTAMASSIHSGQKKGRERTSNRRHR